MELTTNKPCPFCQEPINPKAKKCRFCMEYLPENWSGPSPEPVHEPAEPKHEPAQVSIPPAITRRSGPPREATTTDDRVAEALVTLAENSRPQGGVAAGIVWIAFISMILFFLPVLGPFIAGIVGGRKSGGVLNAIMAALVPSLLLASILLSLSSLIADIPVLGSIATFGSVALAFAGAGPVLIGAIIGGAFSMNRVEPVSKPAMSFILLFCALLTWRVVYQVRATIESSQRIVNSTSNMIDSASRTIAAAAEPRETTNSEEPRRRFTSGVNDAEAARETYSRVRQVGTAMFSWLTDQVGAGAAGQGAVSLTEYPRISSADLEAVLVPQYIQDVPATDGWGNQLEYFLNVNNPLGQHVMLIRSPGRDGIFEGDYYTVGALPANDYDRDIVWADGYFVTRSDKIQGGAQESTTNAAYSTTTSGVSSPGTAIEIPAVRFSRGGNIEAGILPYGDVIHNAAPYGPAPNWVEYDFNVASEGEYELWIEYAADEPRPVDIVLNGRIVATNALAGATGGWHLVNQQLSRQCTVHLSGSLNTLRLERNNVFPHVRTIKLVPTHG